MTRARFPADFDRGACSVLLEYPNLLVLGPTPDDIVMMKTYAAREADVADMVRLWPLCTFDTTTAAAQRFAAAYPHAPEDLHLEAYFADIQRRAEDG
jgi:hypothetical protein